MRCSRVRSRGFYSSVSINIGQRDRGHVADNLEKSIDGIDHLLRDVLWHNVCTLGYIFENVVERLSLKASTSDAV
jgi:hypothetical protein